jgi:hypothetical protein
LASSNNDIRPTFVWTHPNTIGKDYPAFRLRVYKKANNAIVYDSGAQRAPAKNSNGEYSWTAPIYVGSELESGTEYYYTVSMLDAEFTLPNANEAKMSFKLNVSSAAGGFADYGMIPVSVKYMGPAEIKNIRVEAYASPDFSGKPMAVTYAKNTEAIDSVNKNSLNAIVEALPLGKDYYICAYIDTNENRTRDLGESWGYGNFIGTDRKDPYTPRAYALANREINDGTVPQCVIYIEDADIDNNKLPDAWEYATTGKFGGVNNVTTSSPYFVTLDPNGAIAENIFFAIEAGTVDLPFYSVLTQMQNGNKLSAASLALAMAGIDLSKLDVKPEVKITSFSLTDGITIKVDPKAEINGETFKPTVVKVDVKLTLTLQKSDSLTDGWTNVKTISETFTLSSDATEIPSSKLEAMNTEIKSDISGSAGFYRIMVGVE